MTSRSLTGLAVALCMAVLMAVAPLSQSFASPSVTVYTSDLGFVRDTRTLDVADNLVRLGDLPRRLDFASLRVAPKSGKVMRFARRFDVASGDAVLDLALGKMVSVALRGDRIVEGTLLSSQGGWLVVQEADGSLHTVARSSVDDLRVREVAPPFALRPTVEIVLEGARRNRVEAEVSYLTGGLSWSAEHTVVRRGETKAEWSAFVTVDNQTGLDYQDAELKLVAGDINRTGATPMPRAVARATMALEGAAADAELGQESFGDYHLYTLGRPATLRDQESQKLTMLEPRDIKVKPRYLYSGHGKKVSVQLQAQNDQASGLGMPLPGGRVRVYEADASGDLQFSGETRLGHAAAGEELTLEVGSAFDLVAERRELFNRRIADREREYGVEVELRNRKKTAVEIVVHERVSGDIQVTKQSHPFERKDANTLEFKIRVPAGQEVVLSYTARVRY